MYEHYVPSYSATGVDARLCRDIKAGGPLSFTQ